MEREGGRQPLLLESSKYGWQASPNLLENELASSLIAEHSRIPVTNAREYNYRLEAILHCLEHHAPKDVQRDHSTSLLI